MIETISSIVFIVFLISISTIALDVMITGRYSAVKYMVFGMDDDDRKIYNDLIYSGSYKTAEVIIPNCVRKNPEEILNSPKYQELSRKAERMVNGND